MACVDGYDDVTGEPCDEAGGEFPEAPEAPEVPEGWFDQGNPWAGQPGWEDFGAGQWFHPGFGTWTEAGGYEAVDAQTRGFWQIMNAQAGERSADRAERQAATRRAQQNADRYQAYLEKQLAQNAALAREAREQQNQQFLAQLALQREALERQSEENRKNRQLQAQDIYARHTGYFYALPGEPEPPAPKPGLAQSLAQFRG